MKNKTQWFILLVALVVSSLVKTTANNMPQGRPVQVINESGHAVSLYWIHPQTKQETLLSSPNILNGAMFPLDSFVGHEFEIRPAENHPCNSSAKEESCRSNSFVVTDKQQQLVRVMSDMELLLEDNQTHAQQEASDILQQCQESVKKKQQHHVQQAMDDFVQCVESGVAHTLERANEEIAYQATVRKDMANLLENYTCADYNLPSTPDLEQRDWYYPKDGNTRTVHVKHERKSSKIHVVADFISPEECQAMQDAAAPKLHIATVADGKGGSQFSENRKAMQAGITVPWHLEADGDHIARLSRRVYDYTNDVLGLDIREFGQEDLMSIQYFGRGLNDTSPDRYTPHCDGDCTGLPHKHGTRMATMVMYCTLPQVGGATNFRNSGVHVLPEAGNAVFFSYINPETKIMDTGFTEHSGCPVMEGEKKIVTQWIRLGVDEENPWDSFNTLGIKRSDVDDQ